MDHMRLFILLMAASLSLECHARGNSQDGLSLVQGVLTVIGVAVSHAPKSRDVPSDQIEGTCEVKVSKDLVGAIPCNGVELVLTEESGHEVSRVRTDSNGQFEFTGVKTGSYDLKVQSKRMMAPKPIKGLRTGHFYTVSLHSQEN